MINSKTPSKLTSDTKCKSSKSRDTTPENQSSSKVKKSVSPKSKLSPYNKVSIVNSLLSTMEKVYTTKLTSTITFTDAIPLRSNHSGQLLGTILNTSNVPVRVTWDTGAGCSMIERRHLLSNFYPLPVIHNEKGFDLSGVGNFTLNKMTQYVSLPIRLVTDENEIVTFECQKVWIVENYLVDQSYGKVCGEREAHILIGNDFLRNHRLGVEWGERKTRDYLRYRGKEGEFLFPCCSHEESDGT